MYVSFFNEAPGLIVKGEGCIFLNHLVSNIVPAHIFLQEDAFLFHLGGAISLLPIA
jgi:hypothetical protein